MSDLIAQLRLPDPRKRRDAVVALVNAGDASVIDILNRVAVTDSDSAIRDLAAKGAAKLQREQWQQAQKQIEKVALPHELEATGQALRDREARRIGHAQSHLTLALNHHTAHDDDKALAALKQAVTINPQLAQNRDARWLAGELLGISDPGTAMDRLLERIEAEQHARRKPGIDLGSLQMAALALGAALALFLALLVFYHLYTRDLVSIVSHGLNMARLNAFLHALSPTRLATAFLPAMLLFVAITVGNLATYSLSMIWLGGDSELTRFWAAIMIAQALTIVLAVLCLSFMPITSVVEITGADGNPVNVVAMSSFVVAFAFIWTVSLQAYIVSRLQGAPVIKATVVVLAGLVACYVMAHLLLSLALQGVR